MRSDNMTLTVSPPCAAAQDAWAALLRSTTTATVNLMDTAAIPLCKLSVGRRARTFLPRPKLVPRGGEPRKRTQTKIIERRVTPIYFPLLTKLPEAPSHSWANLRRLSHLPSCLWESVSQAAAALHSPGWRCISTHYKIKSFTPKYRFRLWSFYCPFWNLRIVSFCYFPL